MKQRITRQDSISTIKKKKSLQKIQSVKGKHTKIPSQLTPPDKKNISKNIIEQNNKNFINIAQSKKVDKKIGWNAILEEVQFLKRRLSQIQKPNEQQKIVRIPIKNRSTQLSNMDSKMIDPHQVFGKQYSLQSFHLLYEQILNLRNQNQKSKEIIQKLSKQLDYQRKQSLKLSKNVSILTQQNEKLRNQFLGKNIMKHQDSNPHFKTNKSVSSRFNTRQESQKTESIQQQNKKLKESLYKLEQHIRSIQPSMQNLITQQLQPQTIDNRLKHLNQKFQILIFNSKYQKQKQAKSKIREQLVDISEQIKQLKNKKLQSYL